MSHPGIPPPPPPMPCATSIPFHETTMSTTATPSTAPMPQRRRRSTRKRRRHSDECFLDADEFVKQLENIESAQNSDVHHSEAGGGGGDDNSNGDDQSYSSGREKSPPLSDAMNGAGAGSSSEAPKKRPRRAARKSAKARASDSAEMDFLVEADESLLEDQENLSGHQNAASVAPKKKSRPKRLTQKFLNEKLKYASEKELRQLIKDLNQVAGEAVAAVLGSFTADRAPRVVSADDPLLDKCFCCSRGSDRSCPVGDVFTCKSCHSELYEGRYPGTLTRTNAQAMFGLSKREASEDIPHQTKSNGFGGVFYVYKTSSVIKYTISKYGSLYNVMRMQKRKYS